MNPAEQNENQGLEVPVVQKLKFISNDGEVVEVERKAACLSNVLATMLRDVEVTGQEPLPLSAVDGTTLKKVMSWCQDHQNMEYVPKGPGEDKRIPLDHEDLLLLQVTGDELLRLMLAANFLDIPGLIDRTTQFVANSLIGKSVQEMRQFLCLTNDFSPQEEAKLAKQFAWVEAADM